MKKIFKNDLFFLTLLVLISFVQLRFLFPEGFYTFSDEPHMANLYEMIRAISGGQFPPRWAPDMSFNYGYPLFNFYYPFPFYLGSIFFLIFKLSLVSSLKIVFGLSAIFSGVSMYYFARKFFSKITSLSSAILYLYTPYRAVDLYVRGAVGEMWSFVFMPLVLLTIYNFVERTSFLNVLLVSFSLAFLILAHNLTAIIFLPIAVLFFIALIISKKEKTKLIFHFIGSLILGLCLSAYYWLPAVLEKKFIQAGTPFNPFDHFPFIKQLIFPSWGYGASVWGPTDMISFQIGIINLIVILLTILILFIRRKNLENRNLIIFFVGLFFFSCFLMNIRSWFIWQLIPLGDYLQFPWRLLMVTTFVTAFLLGFTEKIVNNPKGKYLPLVLSICAILLTFNYFKPAKILLVGDDYFLNRFFINRTVDGARKTLSKDYLNYSEDYLPLTVWTSQRPSSLPESKIQSDFGKVDYQEITPTKFEAFVSSDKSTNLIFHNYYFPGWQSFIDGENVPIQINKPYGDMAISVRPGTHTIQFKFSESGVRIIANLISLFSIGFSVYILIGNKIPKMKSIMLELINGKRFGNRFGHR